eukprot:g75795.t1
MLPSTYFIAGVFAAAQATPWQVETVPDPVRSSQACGRQKMSWSDVKFLADERQWSPDRLQAMVTSSEEVTETWLLCDPDHILTPGHRAAINHALVDLFTTPDFWTECPGGGKKGVQMAVVVLQKVNELDRHDSLESFARGLHDRWGIGYADCNNNGAVFVVSIDDRRSYISTGKGAKERLSSSDARFILEHMTDDMRRGAYGEAILQATKEATSYLRSPRSLYSRFYETLEFCLAFAFVIFWCAVFLFVCVSCLLGVCLKVTTQYESWKNKRLARSHNDLKRRLDSLQAAMKQGGPVPAPFCPICLDDYGDDQDKLETLWCRHRFHTSCISTWLEKKSSCPVCRRHNPREPSDDSWQEKRSEEKDPSRQRQSHHNRGGHDETHFSSSRTNGPSLLRRPCETLLDDLTLMYYYDRLFSVRPECLPPEARYSEYFSSSLNALNRMLPEGKGDGLSGGGGESSSFSWGGGSSFGGGGAGGSW